MANNIPNIIVRNAKIGWRNFSGRERSVNGRVVNAEGIRGFTMFLDEEQGKELEELGWNIRWREPREEMETPAHLSIAVRFNSYGPKIVLVTSHGRTILDEDTVGQLDYAEIKNVKLEVNPRYWEANGHSGIKAYLKTMYVEIAEDPFEGDYAGSDTDGDIDLPWEQE